MHYRLQSVWTAVIALVTVLLLPVRVGAASNLTEDPSGVWKTADGRGRIRIERCGSRLREVCGYVVWMKEPRDGDVLDRRNPNLAMRSRVLLGHQVILGLTARTDGRFAGDIYNADDGKTYDVVIWRESPNALKLKGCMLAVFCESQIWMKTDDVVTGQLSKPTGSPGGPRADAEWSRLP